MDTKLARARSRVRLTKPTHVKARIMAKLDETTDPVILQWLTELMDWTENKSTSTRLNTHFEGKL